MKKKQSKSSQAAVDGVSQRMRRRNIGDFNDSKPIDVNARMNMRQNHKLELDDKDLDGLVMTDPLDGDEMKEEQPEKKQSWWKRRRARKKEKLANMSRRRRIFRRVGFGFAAVILLLVLALGAKSFLALRNIIDRNGDGALALQENVDPTQLKGEGDGRINIMVLGIGGEGHEGGDLADTIIIASIDPFANEMAMLSVPRDMWVDVPGYWSMKINAAHAEGVYNEHEGGGAALMRETLEETLDIPIHYYVRVDFQGFIQAVDAVGGVNLYVDEAVYDTNFWWQYGILDVPEGDQYFDGERALYFARSRYTSSRGDFSRNERQRQIILALKDKVLSAGTFSNPATISSLIDSAGNHVRTDIGFPGEMLRLYEIMDQIPDENIVSVGLDNSDDNYLIGGNMGGASVLVPKAGDYSEIQRYVRELFVDGFIRQEAAGIDVFNGTTIAGLASTEADLLGSYGYSIQQIDSLSNAGYTYTTIYDLSEGQSPYTKRYLEQRYGVTMESASALPSEIVTESQFVIVLGENAQEEGF